MSSKTWQPGDDKPRTPRATKTRDVELHDVKPAAPVPNRPNWRQPDDWREAKMAAERGEINNAAEAQKILDALSHVSWDKPVARPNPPVVMRQPQRVSPPPTPSAPAAPANADDCDCVVINLGRADADCAKCGGTGYTGP